MRGDAMTGADLTDLVAQLVAIPSFSGHEHRVQDFIDGWLTARGILTRREEARDGLVNVVAEIEGQPGGPVLWIGGHCDTVGVGPGWQTPPHQPDMRDGRLYGRGAMDMKGGLACAMLVADALYRTRDHWAGKIIFASLADEEALSRGADAHVAHLSGVDAAIMCEPHFDDVVIGAMGKVNLDVEVTGRAAHASRPWEGINAVTEAGRLLALIADLERQDMPGFARPSHCVLGVDTGTGGYAISVPERCGFRINWHYTPEETVEDGVAMIEALAAGLQSPARFSVTAQTPQYDGYLISDTDPVVTDFAASYKEVLRQAPRLEIGKGVSDANILAGRLGIPTLLFGPKGGNMHGTDEYVEISSLHSAREVLMQFAQSYLKQKK